jgi:hypothetical protein
MANTICCFARNLTMLSVIASLCLLPVEMCYAGRASTSLGMSWGDPVAEVQLDSSVCNFIYTLAVFRSYETKNNWYGASTTTNNIFAAANACAQQYGIAFYIGHGGNYTQWNQEHWCICDASHNFVWDRRILFGGTPANPPDPSPPTNRPLRFAYIWSCFQGNVIGGVYHDQQYGNEYYGMPYAWLRTTNLDSDGYDFPDHTNSTFIGWLEEAPWLIDPIPWNGHDGQNASYYFLLNFYNSALHYQKRICQSLDDASAAVWGYSSYAMTGFRCGFWYTEPGTGETAWLLQVVYGDGSQRLQ